MLPVALSPTSSAPRTQLVIRRRATITSPANRRIVAKVINEDELLPVFGSSPFVLITFFTLAVIWVAIVVVVDATVVVVAGAAVVVVAGATVVVGATGVPVNALDAGESPSPFTALMLTE